MFQQREEIYTQHQRAAQNCTMRVQDLDTGEFLTVVEVPTSKPVHPLRRNRAAERSHPYYKPQTREELFTELLHNQRVEAPEYSPVYPGMGAAQRHPYIIAQTLQELFADAIGIQRV